MLSKPHYAGKFPLTDFSLSAPLEKRNTEEQSGQVWHGSLIALIELALWK